MTKLVGLTGGIASGKSMVARMFGELGAAVIDTDQVSRDVCNAGTPCIDEIRQAFGDAVIAPDGALDRQAMRAVVFGDREKLKQLESIVHPHIYLAIGTWMQNAMQRGDRIAIIEATLIIESPPPVPLDKLIVVTCDETVRIERTKKRDGFDEAHIRQVMSNQLSDAEREPHADYLIRNDGTMEQTRERVKEVWKQMLADLPAD